MLVAGGFEHFVEQWGYLAILAGTLLEGETVVIAGGTIAHRGVLSFPFVIAVAFIGTVFADNMWFLIGRRFGTPLLNKSEKWRARTDRISNLIKRFGVLFVLGYRFIYGIRTVTPVFLGATGYPHLKFFALDTLSCAVWAIAFSWIGWGIGAGLSTLLNRPTHLTEMIIAGVIASLILWLVTHEIGKRRRRRRG